MQTNSNAGYLELTPNGGTKDVTQVSKDHDSHGMEI